VAEIEIDERGDGRTLAVGAGDVVVIRLPQNAGTGYLWEVAQLDGPGVVLEDDVEPPDVVRPGAAGRRRFRLRFTEPGAVTFLARHRRSWEPEEAEAGRFHLDVRVER